VIRAIAFLRKDLFEVLRQPRLLLTLVLGPFLILLIFGIGFRADPPTLRTVLVIPAGSGLEEESSQLAERISQRVDLVATTPDEEEARGMLAAGQADLVVLVPAGAEEQIRASRQAEISIYHDLIDPFERSFVEIFAVTAVEEANREILRQLVSTAQSEAGTVEAPWPLARAALDSIRGSLEGGGTVPESDLAALAGVVDRFSDRASSPDQSQALDRARSNLARLASPGLGPEESGQIVADLEADLTTLEGEVETFRSISPEVLVSPFVSSIENYQGVNVDFSDYYVPGVVALLLQHLALTFAALSLVRERSLGTVELFRVSPLSGGETLVGKYLAYTLLGGLVGAGLTAAAVLGLGFEMAGSWAWYALIALLVLLAAEGAGFVVSAVARSESEAVQYAMILLLVAIFFSGFFISLDRLIPPVRVLSYLIPATFGIAGMQQVAFRGGIPSLEMVGGTAVLAGGFLMAAWFLINTRVVAGIESPGQKWWARR
jgi:ABC-2 type transport system permease protein